MMHALWLDILGDNTGFNMQFFNMEILCLLPLNISAKGPLQGNILNVSGGIHPKTVAVHAPTTYCCCRYRYFIFPSYHNFAVTIQAPHKGIKFHVKAKKIGKKLAQHLSASFQHLSFLFLLFSVFKSSWKKGCGALKVFPFFLHNMISFMYCFI